VDPRSGKQLAAVPMGGATGLEVAASPDGKSAWVPIYRNSGVGQAGTDGQTISVMDRQSRTLVANIDLKRLRGISIDSDMRTNAPQKTVSPALKWSFKTR
jgi:DNA-binding beta-propeller fold protein YncE